MLQVISIPTYPTEQFSFHPFSSSPSSLSFPFHQLISFASYPFWPILVPLFPFLPFFWFHVHIVVSCTCLFPFFSLNFPLIPSLPIQFFFFLSLSAQSISLYLMCSIPFLSQWSKAIPYHSLLSKHFIGHILSCWIKFDADAISRMSMKRL